jgi:hypothetical protein
LGAPFFWLAPFFEVAFSGATSAPCSALAAVSVVLVASAFFMVVFILLAVDPRMTIHHSGGPGRQGGSSTFWKKEFDGDPELPECSSRQFPISPFFGHKSASDVQLPLSRRSSRRFWVRRSADAGLRYHQELTSLDEQALHRIARAAGRSL